MTTLPHERVYARLGVSRIHGVGVFAIRAIPEGTHIFDDDDIPIAWIDRRTVDEANLPPEIARLYTDFCIIKNGRYGAPASFNAVTMTWYLNEPPHGEEPNVGADADYNLYALRNIEAGEELTLVYAAFSEQLRRYAR